MRQEGQRRLVAVPHAGAEDDLTTSGGTPSQRQTPSLRMAPLPFAARRGRPSLWQERGVLRFSALLPVLVPPLTLPSVPRVPSGRRSDVPLGLGVMSVGVVHGAAAVGEGVRDLVCVGGKTDRLRKVQEIYM